MLLAFSRPSKSRANSTTAHCMPRQMPKKGILWVRAKRMASIFPSIPRIPNPPGTRMPSTPPRSASAPRPSTCSASTRTTSTRVPVGDARVVERLVDRFVRVAMLHVFADDGDPHLVLGVHDPLDHLAPGGQIQRARPSSAAA